MGANLFIQKGIVKLTAPARDQVIAADGKEVYIYFNNTIGIAGIRNARQTELYVKKVLGF